MNINEKETKYVERTLKGYSDKQTTKLDELKRLDKEARRGATVFAYVFGSIGALVLGFGMCVAMQVILADLMVFGIIIGLIGIAMVSVNYSIYNKMLTSSKRKYKDRIEKLSNELLNK